MSRRLHIFLALSLVVLGACRGLPAAVGEPVTAGQPTTVAQPAAPSPAPPTGQPTGGWRLTVYYTPVESFHGPPLRPIADCAGGSLGQHSADFLDRVQTEGYGRVTAVTRGRRYLGWDFERRCWLTAATPMGATDRPLRAWLSTAAPEAVATGTAVRVVGCGSDVPEAACARVRAAQWTVDDRCSDGCSDPKHLDLYIGEEDRPDFEVQSPNYFEARGAVVLLLR